MNIYKIKNINDHVNLIFHLVEGGAYDSMELEEPFFQGVDDVFDFFKISDSEIDKIYDNNIEPIWNTSEELLPIKWLSNIIKTDEFKYPFFIVVDSYICNNKTQRLFKNVQTIKDI